MRSKLRHAFAWYLGTTWAQVAHSILSILTIWLAMIAISALVSGCAPSLAPHGAEINAALDTGIDNAITDIKSGNDRFAKIASNAQCAVTLGAFGRETDLLKSWGMLAMCPEAMAKMSALTTGVPMPAIPAFHASPAAAIPEASGGQSPATSP